MWGEKAGSVTNLEGRVQRVGQKVSPDGTAMPDWRIAAELALRLGVDFDLEQPEEVQDEIARVAPAFAGVDAALLAPGARRRRAADRRATPTSSCSAPVSIPLTDARWEPIRPGGSTRCSLEDAAGRDATEADALRPADDALTDRRRSPTGAPAQPEIHRWTPDETKPAVPARDAYALRLVTGRTLYDGGITVAASGSMSELIAEPVLLVHPQDRDRIGVEDGAEVQGHLGPRLARAPGARRRRRSRRAPRTSRATCRTRPSATLVDPSAAVTDLRVESLS